MVEGWKAGVQQVYAHVPSLSAHLPGEAEGKVGWSVRI